MAAPRRPADRGRATRLNANGSTARTETYVPPCTVHRRSSGAFVRHRWPSLAARHAEHTFDTQTTTADQLTAATVAPRFPSGATAATSNSLAVTVPFPARAWADRYR